MKLAKIYEVKEQSKGSNHSNSDEFKSTEEMEINEPQPIDVKQEVMMKIEGLKEEMNKKEAALRELRKVEFEDVDPVALAVSTLHSWFTIDSYRVVEGEERLRVVLREGKISEEVVVSALGDTDLQEQHQASYRDLVRRLDMMDLLEEEEEEQQERLPLPSFEMLRKHMEQENLKLTSFLAGKSSYEEEPVLMETNAGEAEPRLPLLDRGDQLQLRRGIVLERLGHCLPSLLKTLGIQMQEVRPGLKKLVHSFQLLADNVTLPPESWRFVALLLLGLLAVQDSSLASSLSSPALLSSLGLHHDWLESVARQLTRDVRPLLAKYSIKY